MVELAEALRKIIEFNTKDFRNRYPEENERNDFLNQKLLSYQIGSSKWFDSKLEYLADAIKKENEFRKYANDIISNDKMSDEFKEMMLENSGITDNLDVEEENVRLKTINTLAYSVVKFFLCEQCPDEATEKIANYLIEKCS